MAVKEYGFCFTPFCAFCGTVLAGVSSIGLLPEQIRKEVVEGFYSGVAVGLAIDLLRAVWYGLTGTTGERNGPD